MRYITDGKRHLICIPYSIKNLHLMARNLAIGKWWYHKGGKKNNYPHYDIPKKDQKAIESLCDIVSPKELLTIIKNNVKEK